MRKGLNKIQSILSYTKHVYDNAKIVSKLIHKEGMVLFFMHPYNDVKSGGILSIYFLLEISQKILPDYNVIPITLARLPTYSRVSWFKNDFDILNISRHKSLFEKPKKILIHVPECFFELFCQSIERYQLKTIAKRFIINILNQNQDLMPKEELVNQYRDMFHEITMTLAFEANLSNKYSYLSRPPFLLSTWFYGDPPQKIPFEQKEDIALISPDDHELKSAFIQLLENKLKIECIEIRNMPFEKYKALQRRAKWSFSFGEGYDNYSVGPQFKGGVGFGVYNSNFFPPDISPNTFPLNFFHSYEDMMSCIEGHISKLNNKIAYEKASNALYEVISQHHSPELVTGRLKNYYETVLELTSS